MGEVRSIPTHGDGELEIGGGPIGGVVSGYVYEDPDDRGRRGPWDFMLGSREGAELARALLLRQTVGIKTFHGTVRVTQTDGLAHLWFYDWADPVNPAHVLRLYDGAREVAAEALREACEDAELPAAA